MYNCLCNISNGNIQTDRVKTGTSASVMHRRN